MCAKSRNFLLSQWRQPRLGLRLSVRDTADITHPALTGLSALATRTLQHEEFATMPILPTAAIIDPATTLHDLRNAIVTHRIVTRLQSAQAWRVFMQHHVFAVWDFMSLLKRLQREFTCVSVPWMPRRDANLARFVNAMVFAEESDADASGAATSHFELYLRAMTDCGADKTAIERALHEVGVGKSILEALAVCGASAAVVNFVTTNMDVATHGNLEEITGAFFWGREALIPPMFEPLLRRVAEQDARFGRMHYYLQRHIELDGTDHGPKAEALLNTICRTPHQRLMAQHTAIGVLRARVRLWDSVADVLEKADDEAPLPSRIDANGAGAATS